MLRLLLPPTIAVLFALSASACHRSSADGELAQRCQRALSKVMLDELYQAPDAPGKPGKGEQAIMDTVRKSAQAKCEAEGLTREQAACFEPIEDTETLFAAADYPAIRDHKPSWFQVPPPDIRHQALEEMRAKKHEKPQSSTP